MTKNLKNNYFFLLYSKNNLSISYLIEKFDIKLRGEFSILENLGNYFLNNSLYKNGVIKIKVFKNNLNKNLDYFINEYISNEEKNVVSIEATLRYNPDDREVYEEVEKQLYLFKSSSKDIKKKIEKVLVKDYKGYLDFLNSKEKVS